MHSLLLALTLAASTPSPIPPCKERAATTLMMHYCADARARAADRELAKTYGSAIESAHGAAAKAKIRSAFAAWKRYRDAYLEAMFPEADKEREYGSMYPILALGTRTRLTLREIEDLKRINSAGWDK